MYTGRKFKNKEGNKVSRQVECGTRQRMQINDSKKVNESYNYFKGINDPVFHSIKIIQRSTIVKHLYNEPTSLKKVSKEMDAHNKIDFCKFILDQDRTNYEIDDGKKNYKYINICTLPKTRKEYYSEITDNINSSKYWINWPAHCTGDLPSMSTAILMGFKHGINITKYGTIDHKSKLNEVSAYLGGVIDEDDNQFIINDDGWKGTYNKCSEDNTIKFSWLTRVVATGKYEDTKLKEKEEVKSVGYDNNDKDKVRNAWLGKDNVDKKIESFLDSGYRLTPEILTNKLITILWIRKSGERGGAHFENDTSFNALKCYIETNTAGLIVLAGDKKGTKTNDLKKNAPDRVYDLTEFWNMQGVAEWGGNTRTGQLRLYDYLNRISGNNLKHIGSMSGGLEALALIGHNVYFKAKDSEVGVARMNQYRNTSIKYNRINFARWNSIGYDYAGFEKSAAKYFVFFSSGVIKGRLMEADLMEIYNEKYDPNTNYTIAGSGLNGDNATVARTVSQKLAKKEKMRLEKRAKKILSNQNKKIKKEENWISKEINPNRRLILRHGLFAIRKTSRIKKF